MSAETTGGYLTIREALSRARKDSTEISARTMSFTLLLQFNGSIGSDDGWGDSGSPS
jgi:hypothetical protein